MIKGMLSASVSVGYTLGLLMLITYVFSIALRNLVPPDDGTDTSIHALYFSTVPEAMHSLIIYACFLDNLADFIIAVQEQSTQCFILAWIYIALASLTVMNMLIGVLCEVISAVADGEKESMMVDTVNEKFGKIMRDLDSNNDGTLSWGEFQQILDYGDGLDALESMKIDVENMVDAAEDFFFEDGQPVAVAFPDFMQMVLDLRGGQQATVKDIMGLGKRFNKKFMSVREKIDKIETKVLSMHGSLRKCNILGGIFDGQGIPGEMQEDDNGMTGEEEEGLPLASWQGYCGKSSLRTFAYVCRVAGHCGACEARIKNSRVAHYECECCGTLPYCDMCNGGVGPDVVRKIYFKERMYQ